MRIKTQQDLEQLGKSAQKALAKHLRPQESKPLKGHIQKAQKSAKKNFCDHPSPDPANWLHAALERKYGMFEDGGELVREMIIPGGESRYRFDWAWPRYKVVLEQDGFGFHRSLDAFKRDRRKQMLALTNGWVVVRSTNEDIRKRLEQLLNEIDTVLQYRDRKPAQIKPVGFTQCEYVNDPD